MLKIFIHAIVLDLCANCWEHGDFIRLFLIRALCPLLDITWRDIFGLVLVVLSIILTWSLYKLFAVVAGTY